MYFVRMDCGNMKKYEYTVERVSFKICLSIKMIMHFLVGVDYITCKRLYRGL